MLVQGKTSARYPERDAGVLCRVPRGPGVRVAAFQGRRRAICRQPAVRPAVRHGHRHYRLVVSVPGHGGPWVSDAGRPLRTVLVHRL